MHHMTGIRTCWSPKIVSFPLIGSTTLKGMRRKLHEYVRSCHKWQIIKIQKPKFIDLHQDIAQTPQDHLSIDLLGPYNAFSGGNLFVLTAVCNLIGYLMANPIRDKKSRSLANHLVD